MGITVGELLHVPFFSRTREEKQKIIEEGKPRPPFTLSVVTVNQLNGQVVQAQNFDQGLYDLLPWLTRCNKRRSFFCWPCLLFMTGKEWSGTGVSDGQFLMKGVYDHEASAEHIQAMLDLQMFNLNYIKPQKVDSVSLRTKHHATVKNNREILKRVIDSTCNVVMRAQPLKENDYYNQLNKKDSISILEMLRKYDIQFVDYFDEAIYLLNMHPKFFDDVVDAITSVIKSAIKKEVQLSTYVTVILSEHSEISSRSQISTILRYIKAGKVCERFVGFINTEKSVYAEGLKAFEKTISEFLIKERFLAYSVDGAVVHPTKVCDLLCALKTEYPYSFFVPYYCHGLEYTVLQSISHIKECGLFFKALNEIRSYFKKSSNQWKDFEQFMYRKMPYLDNTNWFKRSELVKVLNTYRKYFIEYFSNIELNCKASEAEDLVKIHGIRLYLEDFGTTFLIRLLTRVFGITSFMNSLLKSKTPENAFDFAGIEQLKKNLRKEQETGFEKIWLHVVVENMKENENVAMRKRNPNAYRELFNKIIGLIIQDIENRFNHLRILEFCHLLNHEKCNEQSINQYVEKLATAHGPYFNKKQMNVEYMVLRNNEFATKPVHELLEFFMKSNLKVTFPYLFKLAELILTLPCGKAPSDRPSKLKQVKKWSYTSEEDNISGDASVLFVEKDLLQELKKDVNFHEEVIHTFNGMSNYIDLIYQ